MWSTVHISILILSSVATDIIAQRTPVTLEEVINNDLTPSSFRGSWAVGSEGSLIVKSGNNIWEYNAGTGTNRTIAEASDFEERFPPGTTLEYTLSPDGRFILVQHARRNYWRHSYFAKYDIFNLEDKSFYKLQPTGFGEGDEQKDLQFVRWSPTGSSLAFVFGNNIHYRKSALASVDTVQQITTNGDSNIFNGICDWVYEEEMFATPVALWFSGDSGRLAFVTFNDTNVEDYQWPRYGEPGNRDTVYPDYKPIKYPKVGFANPEITLSVVDLSESMEHTPVEYSINQDAALRHVIGTVTWISLTKFLVLSFNRVQSVSVWNLCDAISARCEEVYSYAQTTPVGYVDPNIPIVSSDMTRFLILEPVLQDTDPSNHTYRHIVSVSLSSPQGPSTPISAGSLHVDSILSWDETNDKIYFTGTGFHPEIDIIADPSERHVYFVPASGRSSTPICISCGLQTGSNEECKANSISFSGNHEFYLHNCQGPSIPEVTLRRTETGEVVVVMEDNSALRVKLDAKSLPVQENMEVDLPNGFKAKVRLHFPPDFNPSLQYPLLVDVYAGPDSQDLTQDYSIDWGTYMASSKGVIYASYDGRGSGRQSVNLKMSNYRAIGSHEMDDQITVTSHLIASRNYIDPSKVTVWGWSYGGYAATMIMGRDTQNVFKCGVAVAPISTWLYYDTIHTERYQGLPTDEDNFAGYNASSVLNYLENLRGKPYFLIHGNADDNVHYQQSMTIARALEQKDILFSHLSYPDEAHSINGPGMRRHLYHSIERFLFRNCFNDKDEIQQG